ncbi:MAG: acyltransferase family protein [Dehalococcoidales bacterium]|nr:acyltransferase family protein [Dehalococcoidales bacterium]
MEFLAYPFFLMISGYTMFISAPDKGLKDFVLSRMLRLYPVFWIAVTLTSVITFLIGNDRFHVTLIQYFANLTMLNQFIGVAPVDGAWWFMVLLLKFNFIIAVLILLKLIKYQEHIAGIWLLIAIGITFIKLPILSTFLVPDYASFIVAGIIFQSAKKRGWNLYKYILIVVSLLFSMYSRVLNIDELQQRYHTTFSIFVTCSIILVFFVSFYLVTIRKQPIHLPNAFILCGSATYPLYLIHQNIGYMIFNSLGGWVNKYVLLSGTIIIMILASLVIAKYMEPYIYYKLRKGLEAIISFIENIFLKRLA